MYLYSYRCPHLYLTNFFVSNFSKLSYKYIYDLCGTISQVATAPDEKSVDDIDFKTVYKTENNDLLGVWLSDIERPPGCAEPA
jgi:hypothetical protein